MSKGVRKRKRIMIGSFPKILWEYFREQRFYLLLSALCVAAFVFTFYFFKLNLAAVWYPALLSGVFMLVFFWFGFLGFYRKHVTLSMLKKGEEPVVDNLPEGKTLIELDYQELLAQSEEERRREATQFQGARIELADYYAAWMHQIKTPISAMQLLLQGEDTQLNGELLGELFRVEQYVEMALCYIRLGEGASDLVIRERELDEIIRKAVRKYAGQFVRKRIKLVYEGTEKRILTDEKWFSFILEQILSNAVKYTSKGSVEISVGVDDCLRITDSGIGIAPEDLPRIFEKGFTGYNGRLNKKSTGIGLYLVRTAAKKLSHEITVKSEPGQGTVFSVDLRRYQLGKE